MRNEHVGTRFAVGMRDGVERPFQERDRLVAAAVVAQQAGHEFARAHDEARIAAPLRVAHQFFVECERAFGLLGRRVGSREFQTHGLCFAFVLERLRRALVPAHRLRVGERLARGARGLGVRRSASTMLARLPIVIRDVEHVIGRVRRCRQGGRDVRVNRLRIGRSEVAVQDVAYERVPKGVVVRLAFDGVDEL